MKYSLLAIIFVFFIYACSSETPTTVRYMHTIGHEVLHCFFGNFHDDYGRHPTALDLSTKVTDISTITLTFLPDRELQKLYREKTQDPKLTSTDKNVTAVDGFNLRYVNSHVCEVYIAIL